MMEKKKNSTKRAVRGVVSRNGVLRRSGRGGKAWGGSGTKAGG